MFFPRNLSTISLRRLLLAPGLLLFVIGFALRLFRLDAQSLWLDEGGTWSEVTGRTGKGWLALLGELFSKDAAYPLYHVALKAWVALAGDSEWALRFPSALAGAATVLALYWAAQESGRVGERADDSSLSPDPVTLSLRHPTIAALLFAVSPFALWYAQDAKVYSLLMLALAFELWALLRAFARPGPRAWLILIGISLASLFVHRLGLLSIAGAALAYVIVWPTIDQGPRTKDQGPRLGSTDNSSFAGHLSSGWRIGLALLGLALAIAGVAGTIIAVRGESRGAGGHIPAGPFQALGLTFTRFSVDRWPGDIDGYLGLPMLVWLLPCAALTLWGLALLVRDALARHPAAIAIICMVGVPLALLTLALALMAVPIYEARYATVAFPAWMLLLAYPFASRPNMKDQRPKPSAGNDRVRSLVFGPWSLVGVVILVNALILFQPQKGLFSGDPVKEQWREAVAALARQAHPDDLIIVHPYYVVALYDYYLPRATPDPLPERVIFNIFAEGDCSEKYKRDLPSISECYRRIYDPAFKAAAYGKKRALLLIAPDHAKTVDPPPLQDDRYGWVGLRFQFSSDERTWPCGGTGDRYIGVEVMCQSYPSTFNAGGRGQVPQPAVPLDATFGGQLHLRGYSLDLFGGLARPGGTLPVTLYWEAIATPTHDYQMFLHLCHDCASPPLASDDDSPPLRGYAPAGKTTTWQIGDPVHDERTVALPADLPRGRYTLLLGLYPAGDPSERARLAVQSGAPVLGGTRLVLGEIQIGPP
ncbi:MAG TPA: glycosyltransferase family 39 protein [Roseiflexaceae bacterium]|nr:glycosyltransferase family 39 protein [Roseiflexaceae bacterium]